MGGTRGARSRMHEVATSQAATERGRASVRVAVSRAVAVVRRERGARSGQEGSGFRGSHLGPATTGRKGQRQCKR